MEHRSLTELAARGASIPGEWNSECGCWHIPMNFRGDSIDAEMARSDAGLSRESRIWWAPLTDAGDAFRLAEKMRMRIDWDPLLETCSIGRFIDGELKWLVYDQQDLQLAVVLAAGRVV